MSTTLNYDAERLNALHAMFRWAGVDERESLGTIFEAITSDNPQSEQRTIRTYVRAEKTETPSA